jgi:hypothetical protein
MAITFSDVWIPAQWSHGRAAVIPTSAEAAILGVEFATLLDLFGDTLTALTNLRADSTVQVDHTTWLHMIGRSEQPAFLPRFVVGSAIFSR